MGGHTYKILELAGSSEKSLQDAIVSALQTASSSVRHMRWFEVLEQRGEIREGKVAHWQVTLKVGFTLES